MGSEIKNIVDAGLGGFKVLPIKYDEDCSSCHYLYYREHAVKNLSEDRPPGRTLFCVNVPPYASKKSMMGLFRDCGKVENVIFKKNPSDADETDPVSQHFPAPTLIKGFKMAYIVFKSKESVKTALALKEYSPRSLGGGAAGIQKWMEEYNESLPNPSAMQKEVDEYMAEYDKKVVAEEERLKSIAAEPDEEGWTTVTSKGRRPGIASNDFKQKNVMEKEKKKRAKKELLNFYTFQIRETKMKRVEDLRQKFNQDKARIQKMKQSRRFKPY